MNLVARLPSPTLAGSREERAALLVFALLVVMALGA